MYVICRLFTLGLSPPFSLLTPLVPHLFTMSFPCIVTPYRLSVPRLTVPSSLFPLYLISSFYSALPFSQLLILTPLVPSFFIPTPSLCDSFSLDHPLTLSFSSSIPSPCHFHFPSPHSLAPSLFHSLPFYSLIHHFYPPCPHSLTPSLLSTMPSLPHPITFIHHALTPSPHHFYPPRPYSLTPSLFHTHPFTPSPHHFYPPPPYSPPITLSSPIPHPLIPSRPLTSLSSFP